MKKQQDKNRALKEIFSCIVGEQIRAKRLELGLTQENLAERIDGDDKHLGKIERGEKAPSGFTLFNILIELDLDPNIIAKELKMAKKRIEKNE